MKIFKAFSVFLENIELEREIERLETLLEATEKRLNDRTNDYRSLLGEKVELKERVEFLDSSLYKMGKTLESILLVAESNDCGNSRTKVKKIIELAKNETQTSPIK